MCTVGAVVAESRVYVSKQRDLPLNEQSFAPIIERKPLTSIAMTRERGPRLWAAGSPAKPFWCACVLLLALPVFRGSVLAAEPTATDERATDERATDERATDEHATGEPDDASILDMDLEDLLKVRIRIASIDAKPIDSQPAVVTVITSRDIESSGARDLKDILQLVPGFSSGADVCGVVGAGFRGIWAYEGKIQVLVDGIEMNENYFGNVFTMDQFAAANIKHVEILRGPGSAMYGGTAEMAVISITTKGAELNGGVASERLLFHGDNLSHQFAGSFGHRLASGWSVFGNLSYGEVERSDQTYVSPDGTVERSLRGNTRVRPLELNLGISSEHAEVRILYNRYEAQDQIFYGAAPLVMPQGDPGELRNGVLAVSVKGNFTIQERLSISPRAIYRFEEPWWMTYQGRNLALHRHYHRIDLDLPVTIKVTDSSKGVVGIHYYHEYARALVVKATTLNASGITADNYFFGSNHVDRDDFAAYAQYDLDSKWVNVTLGGRYEYHSYSGGTFVPRIGVVKAWDRFHVKALFNQSFRTPNVGVVSDSTVRLRNELTTTYELEAGYNFKFGLSVTGNAYYASIADLIGYDASVNVDRYANGGTMSTVGAELQARYTSARFAAHLGYSYNRAIEQGFAIYSASPALRNLNLNMPAHQVVWSASWHITDALNWNVSGTYLDRRGIYAFPDPVAPSIVGGELLLHTYLSYQWQHFGLGLGVRDLLNQRETVGQPYDGGAGPLRLSGRTFFVQLTIRLQEAR